MSISPPVFAVDGLEAASPCNALAVSERLEDDDAAVEIDERADRACRRRASMAARMAALLEELMVGFALAFSISAGFGKNAGALAETAACFCGGFRTDGGAHLSNSVCQHFSTGEVSRGRCR